jgi:hypothetical protein
MSQIFVILGASIFLLLGLIHGVLTLRDLDNPRTFTPLNVELRHAMQNSPIAIDPSTNLWRAWLGFNLSHSLGIIFFGSTFLYIGINHPLLFAQSPPLQICSLLIPSAYFALSIKFWFSKPAIGSGLALTCFVSATLLSIF